ncbi:hypothetical protein ACRCGH_09345 [Staphylococcus aureus]
MEFNEFKDRAYFFQYINKGPYPDEEEKMKLYSCFCKIYNPSMKDREILKATESKSGLTIIVRSSKTEYLPQTNHLVKIDSALYSDKLFNTSGIPLISTLIFLIKPLYYSQYLVYQFLFLQC